MADRTDEEANVFAGNTPLSHSHQPLFIFHKSLFQLEEIPDRLDVVHPPRGLTVSTGVGKAHWLEPPHLPNRTGGSPAYGSPVDGFTSNRVDGPSHGLSPDGTALGWRRRRSAIVCCQAHRHNWGGARACSGCFEGGGASCRRAVGRSTGACALATRQGRTEFTCVADESFTSRCSPPRRAATQLRSVTGRSVCAWRGLPPLGPNPLADALGSAVCGPSWQA
jgi:hypothetical protein